MGFLYEKIAGVLAFFHILWYNYMVCSPAEPYCEPQLERICIYG